jgi:hypothetical protein
MNKRYKFALVILGTLALALVIYFVWPREQLEVRVQEARESPDRRWTAVVQMEIYSSISSLSNVVYTVRLKGPAQKDRQGDLVMNVPVNYPDPAPSADWNGNKLVVTMTNHEKYQYLANPVSGVPVEVKHK